MQVLTTPQNPLIPTNADKDAYSRLSRYARWLDDKNLPWFRPNLTVYRDHLLETLSPSSVQAQ